MIGYSKLAYLYYFTESCLFKIFYMAIPGKVRITIYPLMYDNVIVLSLFSLPPKKQSENGEEKENE